MRLKPSICAFFIVCWALVSSLTISAQEAQEGKSQPDEMVGGMKPDPDPSLSESDTRTKSPAGVGIGASKEAPRDSIQVIKVVKPFKPLEKVEKEEDPLSFNFLFYIIEKFKMSDIIE